LLEGPDDLLGVLLERLVLVIEDRADVVGFLAAAGARRQAAGFLLSHVTTPVRSHAIVISCLTG
jgi:hypothetical protein